MNPIKQGLLDGTIKIAHHGDTIEIYSDTPDARAIVDKAIHKALYKDGRSLHNDDGSRTFIIYDVIHPYIWDKSGNRCKYNVVKHLVAKDGTHTTSIVRTTYRSFS